MRFTISLSLSAVSVAGFGLQPCHGSGSVPYRDETGLEVSLEVSVHGLTVSKAGRSRGERKSTIGWKLSKCWIDR